MSVIGRPDEAVITEHRQAVTAAAQRRAENLKEIERDIAQLRLSADNGLARHLAAARMARVPWEVLEESTGLSRTWLNRLLINLGEGRRT